MPAQTKWRREIAPYVALVSFFTIANLAFAETKVFIEEYTYQASEADSKLSSRVIALEQIKRLLLEKLGTYLESQTEVKNFKLTKDQIVILTAGIVKTEIVDEKWDGKIYFLRAKIATDPKDVVASINKLREDRLKTKELEETRKRSDETLREIERLIKMEMELARAQKPNLNQYNQVVNRLSAIDWVKKGYALGTAGKNKEMIEAYTTAIELDPIYALAYYNRGTAYHDLGDHRQAIRDFDKAIDLDPTDSAAYYGRGAAYAGLGNHRQAIRDFDKAIELDPKKALAYYGRGLTRGIMGDHRQAIMDFDKAIEIDPKLALAYYNRGASHQRLRNYRQALEDLKIAARLGCREAQEFLRSKGISW